MGLRTEVLDLFSAAAGGWSLGMHRAGFRTIAACEAIDWRRALYAQNNPGVPIYDDVRSLTAGRLLADLGRLPGIIVGSPPCQDISSANTKGKGVEGERSGLYFEAVRIIGECRPRWFALENSANLRTRGADAVLAALEALEYTCWTFVVRAGDVGANHERPRCWIIGCDLAQVGNPDDQPRAARFDPAPREGGNAFGSGRFQSDTECGGNGSFHDANTSQIGCISRPGNSQGERDRHDWCVTAHDADDGRTRNTPHPDQAGQADGRMVAGLRQAEIADDGCSDRRGDDEPRIGQMAVRAPNRGDLATSEPLWSLADLAGRLRLDDGLPARVAGTRVAVGGPRGTSASSLIVEAYGDAVVPQIPEAIGRAILRVERAFSTLTEAAA